MIVKEPHKKTATHATSRAGQRQESDVAFYLRRELGDAEDAFVFHDLNITHNGENAQIDHLVLHKCGFILIESKSIQGEVTVNAQGEWSRSHRGKWSGMKSPLRQAELQKAILHNLLAAHYDQLLGTVVGIQKKVSHASWWAVRCAVSSDAILHREHMPKEVSEAVIKAEFLGEEVRQLLKPGRVSPLHPSWQVQLPDHELAAIRDFLLEQDRASTASVTEHVPAARGKVSDEQDDSEALASDVGEKTGALADNGSGDAEAPAGAGHAESAGVACKSCGASDGLEPRYGRYGYYVVCGCGTNTSMKVACPQCGARKTWVSKSGPTYTLSCKDCAYATPVFTAASAS